MSGEDGKTWVDTVSDLAYDKAGAEVSARSLAAVLKLVIDKLPAKKSLNLRVAVELAETELRLYEQRKAAERPSTILRKKREENGTRTP